MKPKRRLFQLRVDGDFLSDLKDVADIVNDSNLRAQALARGFQPVNCADLVNIALLSAYNVGDSRALDKIGAGFDQPDAAIRRITWEVVRRRRDRFTGRRDFQVIEGGAS